MADEYGIIPPSRGYLIKDKSGTILAEAVSEAAARTFVAVLGGQAPAWPSNDLPWTWKERDGADSDPEIRDATGALMMRVMGGDRVAIANHVCARSRWSLYDSDVAPILNEGLAGIYTVQVAKGRRGCAVVDIDGRAVFANPDHWIDRRALLGPDHVGSGSSHDGDDGCEDLDELEGVGPGAMRPPQRVQDQVSTYRVIAAILNGQAPDTADVDLQVGAIGGMPWQCLSRDHLPLRDARDAETIGWFCAPEIGEGWHQGDATPPRNVGERSLDAVVKVSKSLAVEVNERANAGLEGPYKVRIVSDDYDGNAFTVGDDQGRRVFIAEPDYGIPLLRTVAALLNGQTPAETDYAALDRRDAFFPWRNDAHYPTVLRGGNGRQIGWVDDEHGGTDLRDRLIARTEEIAYGRRPKPR